MYKKVASAILAARAQGDAEPVLQVGTLALAFNGGRDGNKKALLSPWKAGELKEITPDEEDEDGQDGISCRAVTVWKDEASLRARRNLSRGTAVVQQSETLYLISRSNLNLPERDGCLGGTNSGIIIGPVHMPPMGSDWKMTRKDINLE